MKMLPSSLPVAAALLLVLAAFVATAPPEAAAERDRAGAVDAHEHGASGVDAEPQTPLASTAAAAAFAGASASTAAASSVVDAWPEPGRSVARRAIEKYGQPDSVSVESLTWSHRGPWKRIVARRDSPLGSFTASHADFLEQTVTYDVPAAKLADLAAFDPALLADRAREELTARSDSEEHNLLALNLADEILRGKRTVTDARSLYDKTSALRVSGKSSPYTQRLLFTPLDKDSGDMGRP